MIYTMHHQEFKKQSLKILSNLRTIFLIIKLKKPSEIAKIV